MAALAGTLLGWLGNQGFVMRVLNRLGKKALQKMTNNL